MQEIQDIELLRQYARENSDEAFATLVARHVNMVHSAALRKTGNPAAAEEITQAVFVILARKADELLRHPALSGWLYQATRLTAANFLRTEIRRTRREQEACMQALSNQTEPEIWPQIMPLLEDAMGRLGEKDRDALALRFFEGKSFQEIGAAFGVSENAARKRTNHALEKLRCCFSQGGVTSTTETIAVAISANSVQAAPSALAKAATAAAIAKGATASTSTLSLIKGSLKIIAWTKIKTTAVVRIVAFLAGTIIIAFSASGSASGNSKVSVKVLNPTNASGTLFYVLKFTNQDRKPVRWRGIWSEVENNQYKLAPIRNFDLPWEMSSNPLAPGHSMIMAVGAPVEPGRWRVWVEFSPNATTNIRDGLTNICTVCNPWFNTNR